MTAVGSYYLYPSAIFITEKPLNIDTILGSCVGVCLWDHKLLYGGMNHYMLPFWNGEGLASPKYGNIAIKKLIDNMEKKGSKRQNLIAKIFGGGKVLQLENNFFNIGERNIALAEKLLSKYRIPIVASSIGGDKGRKISFNTYTGKVRLQYVNGILRK